MKKIEKAKPETIIRVKKRCSWSSETGGPTYVYIKCLDDKYIEELILLREKVSKNKNRIDEINHILLTTSGDLIKEKAVLEKELKLNRNKLRNKL